MLYTGIISKVDTISSNDSAYFPKDVVQEYLNSDDFKTRRDDGLILGTITHKYRNGAEKIDGLGDDDRLLDEGVITHIIRDSWIEGNNWMATIEVLDDLGQYAEQELPAIKQLLRLLNNGVNLTCSIVVDADWDEKDNAMSKLYELVGLDFTLNPALRGSKLLNKSGEKHETN